MSHYKCTIYIRVGVVGSLEMYNLWKVTSRYICRNTHFFFQKVEFGSMNRYKFIVYEGFGVYERTGWVPQQINRAVRIGNSSGWSWSWRKRSRVAGKNMKTSELKCSWEESITFHGSIQWSHRHADSPSDVWSRSGPAPIIKEWVCSHTQGVDLLLYSRSGFAPMLEEWTCSHTQGVDFLL